MTGAELEHQPATELVLPYSGLVVDLTAPQDVAEALQSVRDAVRLLGDVRRQLEETLQAEAARQGTKTLHLDGISAEITGGPKHEYDPEALQYRLLKAGMPEPQIREVVKEIVTLKVDAARAKRAAGANPAYAQAVEASRRTVETAWRVNVKPR